MFNLKWADTGSWWRECSSGVGGVEELWITCRDQMAHGSELQ